MGNTVNVNAFSVQTQADPLFQTLIGIFSQSRLLTNEINTFAANGGVINILQSIQGGGYFG